MNVSALAALIGRRASWRVDKDIIVTVNVVDAREAFGRIDILVRPLEGTGEKWVRLDSVSVE